MTRSDQQSVLDLIYEAALEVLRNRVRAAEPGPYREALVRIGTDMRVSACTATDLHAADLASAKAAIECAPAEVRARCTTVVESAERAAKSRGLGVVGAREERDIATMCAALWWCDWTSIYDEACAAVGYPMRQGIAWVAETRAAEWKGGAE